MDYGSALFWFVSLTVASIPVVPRQLRPLVLLLSSYGFLALWSPPGLGVLVFVTVIAYLSGRIAEVQRSRAVIGLCVAATISPLCILKFIVPILPGYDVALGSEGNGGFLLQFGLSFFTLQAVGYILEVRYGQILAERRCTRLALYLAFFPKLLAGPIERAGTFMSRLGDIRPPHIPDIIYAGKLILLGLFSKFVLADTLADVGVELSGAETAGGAVVALSCAAYSYQIYLDFLGYSAIAIGVGQLFGIELSENFRTPYAARSLQQFWRCWHMTLSFWFRDFVYKPLGGSRSSERTRWATVMLVFIFSGLWHGSALTFLIWGGLHGALYLIGTSTLAPRRRAWARFGLLRVPLVHHFLQVAFVFVATTVAWVFFRSPDVTQSLDVLGRAAGTVGSMDYFSLGTVSDRTVILAVGLLLTLAIFDISRIFERFPKQEPTPMWARVGQFVALDAMIIGSLIFGSGEGSSFIYFRF